MPANDSHAPSSPASGARNVLQICRTCPRYEPAPRDGAHTLGRALADRVLAALEDWPQAGEWSVRVVHCLGGCPNPCNVAVSGPGKWRLRVKRFVPDEASLVLDLCEAHRASPDGDLAREDLPSPLRERVSSRTPPGRGQ